VSDARFFRIVAGGERKSLFASVFRKCDVIYRKNVQFNSEQTGTEQTAGAEQFHAAGRLGGSLRVRKIIRESCR